MRDELRDVWGLASAKSWQVDAIWLLSVWVVLDRSVWVVLVAGATLLDHELLQSVKNVKTCRRRAARHCSCQRHPEENGSSFADSEHDLADSEHEL